MSIFEEIFEGEFENWKETAVHGYIVSEYMKKRKIFYNTDQLVFVLKHINEFAEFEIFYEHFMKNIKDYKFVFPKSRVGYDEYNFPYFIGKLEKKYMELKEEHEEKYFGT